MRSYPREPQKGPRAYILFHEGRAVGVYDMAKHADAVIRGYRKRGQQASRWRRSSRIEAEEYAAWHNYKMDQADALYRVEAERRRHAWLLRRSAIEDRI